MTVHTRYVRHLKRLPGVDDAIADDLIQAGLFTIKRVDRATEDEVYNASKGLTRARARAIKNHLEARKKK